MDEESSLKVQSLSNGTNYESCSTNASSQVLYQHVKDESEKKTKKWRDYTRKQIFLLISLVFVQFGNFCVVSLIAPFYPKEAESKGMSLTVSGVVFGIYSISVATASPLVHYVFVFITPKSLLLLSTFLRSCCNIAFGFYANIDSLLNFSIACIATRAVEGITAAGVTVSIYTIVGTEFQDKISIVMSMLELVTGLGLSVGPAIGAILYNAGGFGLPFCVIGGIFFPVIPIVALILQPKHYGSKDNNTKHGLTRRILSTPGVFILLLAATVVSDMGTSFLCPTLEPHLRKEYGISTVHASYFFVLFSVCYTIACPVWGLIIERFNKHTARLFALGLLGTGIPFFLLGPSWNFIPKTIWTQMGAIIIIALFSALACIPSFQMMLEIAKKNVKDGDDAEISGVISGLWTSSVCLSEVSGFIGGAAIADYFKFSTSCDFFATLYIVSGLTLLLWFR